MGRACLRASGGISLSHRSCFLSAGRSICGGRDHAARHAGISQRAHRCHRPACRIPITVPKQARMALDSYSRAFSRACIAVAGKRSLPHRGRRLHHHEYGFRLFGRNPGTGIARTADISYRGLDGCEKISGDSCRAGAGTGRTGHGRAMQGVEMRQKLHTLALEFERFAVPQGSYYVQHPARAEDGSAYKT